MAVGYSQLPELQAVEGIRLGVACAGIKYPERRDLVVIEMSPGTTTAATFTRNAFCAAPVTLAKKHLQATAPAYLLINTGNANAGTGEQGLKDARQCCEDLAAHTGCEVEAVLPFSTGVIGESLPVEAISNGIPHAVENLSAEHWGDAAHGIMTTDTVAKGNTITFELDGQSCHITGIAKGSGMIRPDMATMLAYLATDLKIEQALLLSCLQQAVAKSFNRVTVDGDTSTNDACVLMATGQRGIELQADSVSLAIFQQALETLCQHLAQLLIRDGEGASKFITVAVRGGESEQACEQVAFTVAHSPLVKTALFASDPNWGRILAAVGRAGLPDLVLENVNIYLDDVCIVSQGGRDPVYSEAAGQKVMSQDEITITIELGRGEQQADVWTCDFSYDYVRINAEYRT